MVVSGGWGESGAKCKALGTKNLVPRTVTSTWWQEPGVPTLWCAGEVVVARDQLRWYGAQVYVTCAFPCPHGLSLYGARCGCCRECAKAR